MGHPQSRAYNTVKNKENLKQKTFFIYNYIQFLKLENSHFQVEIKNRKAYVTFRGKALWKKRRSSEMRSETMNLKVSFQKNEDNEWKCFLAENIVSN